MRCSNLVTVNPGFTIAAGHSWDFFFLPFVLYFPTKDGEFRVNL